MLALGHASDMVCGNTWMEQGILTGNVARTVKRWSFSAIMSTIIGVIAVKTLKFSLRSPI